MMIPTIRTENKVYHSGNISNFQNRLKNCFTEIYRNTGLVQKMLTQLGSIGFNPEVIALDKYLTDNIFDIVTGTKQEMCSSYKWFLRYPKGASDKVRKEIQYEHDRALIERIPDFYNGEDSSRIFKTHWRNNATMFDFLNIFTEEAKSEGIAKKLSIEGKTGVIANYIYENAKKFHYTSNGINKYIFILKKLKL